MARKKKLSPNQQAYRKQVARIRKAFSALKKQGYRFSSPLEKIVNLAIPTRVTKKRLAEITAIKPATLRKEATALSESGKIISGEEKARELKALAGKKAAETRKKRAYYKRESIKQQKQEEWLRKRREQDERDRQMAIQYHEGEIIYQNLLEMFDMYPTKGARKLREMLNYQMTLYGKDNVLQAISQVPAEAIKTAQEIIYYEKDRDSMHRAFQSLSEIIKGEISSIPERIDLEDFSEELDDFPEFNMY